MTTKKLNAYSDAEWQARVDLAAAYRLTAHFGMTALINNHITSRVPGTDDQFLINEFGLGYDEVTASNLVKIDLDGNVLEEGEHRINTGYRIHSAIHAVRHDVTCIMHTHTPYGMVVSTLEEGLLPLQQETYRFHERVSYHEFGGVALDADECERLVTDLGSTNAMILRNHGLLTLGRSVAEAWTTMWEFERACQIQVLAQSTAQAIRQAPLSAIEKTAGYFDGEHGYSSIAWSWLLRTIDRKDASYKE